VPAVAVEADLAADHAAQRFRNIPSWAACHEIMVLGGERNDR
jgi:hypothetical protein